MSGERCRTCGAVHITWQRPDGIGYCCGFRTPAEHYHDSYEEMLVCKGLASEKATARAERQKAIRTGTRGRHKRAAQGAADKPLPSEGTAA